MHKFSRYKAVNGIIDQTGDRSKWRAVHGGDLLNRWVTARAEHCGELGSFKKITGKLLLTRC